MPFSFAIFLAKGEAKILPSFTTCTGAGFTAVAIGAGVARGVDIADVVDAAGAVACAAPPFNATTIGAMSKPCCPMIQSKSFTKIFSPA